MAILCSLAEKYPKERILKMFDNSIKRDENKWSSEPYSIVFNFKELLKQLSGTFNDEWFNDEMNYVFESKGLKYSADLLNTYEKSLLNKKSCLYDKFAYKGNFLKLFKKSTTLYQYFENKFNNDLINCTFVDLHNKKFIKTNNDLNISIINLKNRLFNVLKDKAEIETTSQLYNDKGILNYSLYQKVMSTFENDQKFNEEKFNTIIINSDLKNSFVDPYISFITLLNFDSFISDLFPGIISINQSYKGSLNNPINELKYLLNPKGSETAYWMKENEAAHDPVLVSSPTIKKIANTIPLYDANNNLIRDSYLGLDKILSFGGKLKSIELLFNDLKSFRSNPKKVLLEYLDNDFKYKGLFDDYKSQLNSLRNYINQIQEIENNDNTLNGDLSNTPDIISMLAWEIDKSFSPIYIRYSDTETKQLNMSEYENANGVIKDNTISEIVKRKSNDFSRLTGKDFDEKNIKYTLRKINSLLGLDLNEDVLISYSKSLNPDKKIDSLINARGTLTTAFNNIFSLIKSNFSQIQEKAKEKNYDLIDSVLTKSNDFNALSKTYLKTLRIDAINILRKENGDGIPTNRITSLGGNDKESIESFTLRNSNLIKDNPGFLKATALRMEVVTQFAIEGKETSKLNTNETTIASFYGEFVDQYSKGEFITQPVAYSDKPSDFLKIFDLLKLKENTGKDLTNENILQLYFNQNNAYFNQAIQKVLNDLAIVLDETLTGNLSSDIERINNALSKKKDYQVFDLAKNKNTEIVKDLHFSKYKEGLRLNRGLLNAVTISNNIDNFKEWNKLNSINFLQKLNKNNLHIFDFRLFNNKIDVVKDIIGEDVFGNPKEQGKFIHVITDSSDPYIISNIKKYSELYKQDSKYEPEFRKFSDLRDLVANGKKYIKSTLFKINNIPYFELSDIDLLNDENLDLSKVEINPLIDKYVGLTNMTKDSYLSITTQFPYLYGSGGSINGDIRDENSNAFKKMSKRMVNHTASVQNYIQGLDNGIPSSYKLAIISDPQSKLFNYMGNTPGKKWHEQDVEDGSARGNPFMTRLEENSLLGLGVKGTQKPFWATIKPFVTEESKFAKFEISNYRIRTSMDSDRPEIILMEKMNNLKWVDESGNYLNIDLTKNFNNGLLRIDDIKKSLNIKNIYYMKNGKYYMFNSLERVSYNPKSGSFYNINISQVDINGNPIKEGRFTKSTTLKDQSINTLFDLWKIFGGQNSVELKNGKLDFSELSNDIVTKYITNVGTITEKGMVKDFPLKNFMIAAVLRTSAQKVGQTNVNSVDIESNNQSLNYYTAPTTNFGIQLDAGHDADESDLTEPTQVITALAALGYTTNITQETYNDIADIMRDSLKEPMQYLMMDGKVAQTEEEIEEVKNAIEAASINIPDDNTETEIFKSSQPKDTYEYLAKWIVDEFAHAQVIGVAQSSIDTIIENSEGKIPFSSPSIYGLFVTNLLSNLNRKTLRRKFAGLGMVLNPSHGTMQIFDINDKTMMYTDLLNELGQFLNKSEYTEEELLIKNELESISDEHQQIKRYLEFINPEEKRLVHCSEIQLLESYEPIFNISNHPELQELNIVDLNDLQNKLTTLADEISDLKYGVGDFIDINSEENKANLELLENTYNELSKVYDNIIKQYKPKTLLTPKDIQEFHDLNIQVYRVNKSRDLKPSEITWVEDGIKKSIWTADALRISTNYFNKLTPEQEVIADSYFNYKGLNRKKLSPKQQHLELQKWVQATFEKLHNNSNFELLSNFVIEGGYDWDSYFNSNKSIENLNYKKAELILPKVYESAFGLTGYSLYDIEKLGALFFKNKLEINYDSKLDNVDLLIRLKDQNIHVIVSNNDNLKVNSEKILYDDFDGIRYRVDEFGNKMYKLPDESFVIKQGGVEVVVLKNTEKVEEFVKSLKNKISTLEILGNNVKSEKDLIGLIKIGKRYNKLKIYKSTYNSLLNIDLNKISGIKIGLNDFYLNQKDFKLQSHANAIYSSFLKSKEVISARIPSQALQSFMSMNTVGFIENGNNDGYVSVWQLYLQGSDLDIDKAYTILNSIKTNGFYDGWSSLFDYSSIETLKQSENLPKPNKFKISEDDGIGVDESQIQNYNNLTYFANKLNSEELSIDDWVALLRSIDYNKPFAFVKSNEQIKDLDIMNNVSDIIDKINEHNLFEYSSDSIKNKVRRGMDRVIEDMRNQISANSPISMGVYTDISEKADSSDRKNMYDGNMSINETKEANFDGKGTVGIMANGLKAFFSLTQYFNNFYQNNDIINKTSPAYFQKKLTLNGVDYYLSSISDIRININQKEILRQYLNETFQNDSNVNLLFNENNADLNLSALTSLATDNAKELALAKLNAGIDLASIHVYLTILGLDPEIICDYMMTNPDVLSIKSQLSGNIFLHKAKSLDAIVKKDKYPEFYEIFKGSRELRSLNSFLRLNQGTKSDIYEVHDNIQSMQNGLLEMESVYMTKDKKAELTINDIDISSIIDKKPYLTENEIVSIINNAISFGIFGKGINIESFVNNEDYANAAINYYNILKNTINIYDVVNTLPHFKEMLKGLVTQLQLAKKSAKYSFVENNVIEVLNLNKDYLNKKIQTVNANPNYPSIYNKDLARKASNFFDEYVISEFFKSDDLNYFNMNLGNISKQLNSDVEYLYGNGVLGKNSGQNEKIDLSTNNGIASFKLLMDKYLIPLFKKQLQGNEFIQNLIMLDSAYAKKYRLSVNASNLKNPIMQRKMEMILSGFDEISNLASGIKNTSNQDLNYGDLFFIYNTITNKMRNGGDSLSIVFQNYAKNSNSLNHKMNMFYDKYDSKELNLDNISNNDLLFSLYSEISGDSRSIILPDKFVDGEYTDEISLNLPKVYYNFSVGVDSFKKQKSKSVMVTSILGNLLDNIITLELNC